MVVEVIGGLTPNEPVWTLLTCWTSPSQPDVSLPHVASRNLTYHRCKNNVTCSALEVRISGVPER